MKIGHALLLTGLLWGHGLVCGAAVRKCMNAEQCLSQFQITTRVGHAVIAPGDGAVARILAAVEASAKGDRLPGLDDEMNPLVLDAAKVKAFLQALPKVPAEALVRLRGRMLHLNDGALGLGCASALTPAILESGFRLQVADGAAGKIVHVRIEAKMDKKLARERAARARDAVQRFGREVETLEEKSKRGADSDLLVSLSTAKQKRFAAASVWRDLTKALVDLEPGDAPLRAEAATAKDAASKFIVAPWTGMPQ